MKTKKSGNSVKVANQKVVEEMLSFINTPGKFSEKKKAIWYIKTERRPGKEIAEQLRIDYVHKFDWFTGRNILGNVPRGFANVKKDFFGKIIELTENKKWEYRFVEYLENLYSVLDFTMRPKFYGSDFNGKLTEANKIRAEHIAKIESLKAKSEALVNERVLKTAKEKATVYNFELSKYLQQNFPYREASGKWAGGNTTINVYTRNGYECEGSGTSFRVWSDNGKWSGLDAEYKFFVQDDEKLVVIGGLVTIYKSELEKSAVKQCTWFEQSRGFELVQKFGFLVGGYHSEAKTKEAAIKGAKQSKNYLLSKDDFVLTVDFAHKKYGFCLPGIRNFMNQNSIESDKITVAELRNIVIKNRELNCNNYRSHLLKMGIVLNCK